MFKPNIVDASQNFSKLLSFDENRILYHVFDPNEGTETIWILFYETTGNCYCECNNYIVVAINNS